MAQQKKINWLVPIGAITALTVVYVLPAVKLWISGGARLVEPVLISEGENPSFSPDGKSILYQSNSRCYLKFSSGRGEARLVVDGEQPVWSPDGAAIAFTSRTGIAIVAGAPPRKLTDSGANPAWSPDGRHIVYEANAVLWMVPAAGGKPEQLTQTGTQPEFHPSGQRVGFLIPSEGQPPKLWEIDPSDKKLTEIGPTEAFAYSPNGAAVYLMETREGVTGLYRLVRGGKQPEWVMSLSASGTARDLTVSRDGTHIAYTGESEDKKNRVFVAELPSTR